MEHAPNEPFDPEQFDYLRFYPPEMHQFLREHTATGELLKATAKNHPDIPEESYEMFFTMDSIVCQATGAKYGKNPSVFVPIIDEAYQKLKANAYKTDLVTIQLTAALHLNDVIVNKTASGGRYAAINELRHLGFFAEFARGAQELEQKGELNIDITRDF